MENVDMWVGEERLVTKKEKSNLLIIRRAAAEEHTSKLRSVVTRDQLGDLRNKSS